MDWNEDNIKVLYFYNFEVEDECLF